MTSTQRDAGWGTSRSSGWDPGGFRADVQAELESFVATQRRNLEPLGPDALRLADAARAAITGGKRFRAMFCYWGFRAVRPCADREEEHLLLRASTSLELLHASALVHDDLMDASDTRRGHASVHREFERTHRRAGWRGDSEQYGAAAAVLLGDLLLSWADERLRTCGFPEPAVLRALRVLDTTRTEVVAGQFLDVSAQARGDSDLDQAMRVLRYKSAKYSVERPLHIGATLAGSEPETLQALTAYGVPVGEAFQLRDDLLGVFGDPSVTGKPAGDDLSEGKRTLLVALAMSATDATDARLIDESLGSALDPDRTRALQAVIARSGAQAEVERRIEALTATGLVALDDPAVSAGARDPLRALAGVTTQRVG